MDASESLNGRFYQNPVLNSPFADPFVLKHGGDYWGYSTGFWRDGRVFGVAHSRDLIHWNELQGAMEPLPDGHTCYWAPEVVYDSNYEGGRFLLYYSVGNETLMHIRVAVAEHPAGPFLDSGHELTHEEFAIDPHVFIDDDGARYLFYATDFLKHTHIGTGTVVDRLLDSFTLAGEARPVTRARFDWQIYDPQRATKGGVRWHTVEGPSVLKRKGRYYQMLSGGNWQNTTYGVSYAATNDINAREEWEQASDGERVLPILRTLPGQVIGPGHNSVVRGPDNQQLFCVYHRWSADGGARVMCIDRLDWVGARMTVLGPSTSFTAAPIAPTATDFDQPDATMSARGEPGPEAVLEEAGAVKPGLGELWEAATGQWARRAGVAVQSAVTGGAEARCQIEASHFIAEVNVKPSKVSVEGGCGIALGSSSTPLLRALLVPTRRALAISVFGAQVETEFLPLPSGFDAEATHTFRVEANGQTVRIKIDEGGLGWRGRLTEQATSFALHTESASAEFAGFALTVGWQDLFERENEEPSATGWQPILGEWKVADGSLGQRNAQIEEALIIKGPRLASYELVINARLLSGSGSYGVCPALTEAERGVAMWIEPADKGWTLIADEGAVRQAFVLPTTFDPAEWQMFRMRKEHGRLTLQLEAQPIGTLACTQQATRIGLFTRRAAADFEMVRLTAITE